MAKTLPEEVLIQAAMKVIENETANALETVGFLTASMDILKLVLQNNKLKINELELFMAVRFFAVSNICLS